MPAMMLPGKHKYDYAAIMRIVVSDEIGASDFIEVSIKVSYAIMLLVIV